MTGAELIKVPLSNYPIDLGATPLVNCLVIDFLRRTSNDA